MKNFPESLDADKLCCSGKAGRISFSFSYYFLLCYLFSNIYWKFRLRKITKWASPDKTLFSVENANIFIRKIPPDLRNFT